jgi:hypothetical protein
MIVKEIKKYFFFFKLNTQYKVNIGQPNYTTKQIIMKKQISYCCVAILSLGLFFTACKKKDADDNSAQYKIQSDDQSRFTNETDAVANDVNTAVENSATTFGERPTNPLLPQICDATVVVDTVNAKITITYSGNNCSGSRTRAGVVVISYTRGARWRDAGTSYTVTYQNLKITRVSDGKSITINGAKTVTNVSGGRLRNLSAGSTITHTVKSTGMTITFDDGSQRSWQIAKQRTFTYDNGIVVSVTGIATQGNGIAEWGINRYGNAFTNAIIQPLTFKQSCQFRLVSGETKHVGPIVTIATTYGLDATGNAVATCPTGAYYFKSVWTGASGNSYTYIAPY